MCGLPLRTRRAACHRQRAMKSSALVEACGRLREEAQAARFESAAIWRKALGKGRFYDDDLHPRLEQTGAGHPEPAGRGTANPPKSFGFPS